MACPGIVSVSSATASVCPAASDALRETPRAPYQQQPPPLLAGAVLLPIGSEALLAAAMLGCVAMRVLISDACDSDGKQRIARTRSVRGARMLRWPRRLHPEACWAKIGRKRQA